MVVHVTAHHHTVEINYPTTNNKQEQLQQINATSGLKEESAEKKWPDEAEDAPKELAPGLLGIRRWSAQKEGFGHLVGDPGRDFGNNGMDGSSLLFCALACRSWGRG